MNARSARMAISVLAVAALTHGCRPSIPSTVVRVVDGESREGPFVSPYAYEHFLLAELAAARGDDATAADEYELARLGPSDDALVASRQAEALDRLGRVERADSVLEEAERLDARSEAVALARSRIAERRGDADLALREAVRACELAPRSIEAWRRVATLLAETERAPELLARLGDDPLALRARLAIATSRGDAREAEAALEALSRVAPVAEDERARTVELALAEGRVMLAVHLAERLTDRPESAALRARAWVAAGRRVEAEGTLAIATPETFGGPRAMAELWLEAGRPDRAVELARAALALGDVQARLVLARALAALGEPVEAAEQAARIRRDASDREEARVVLRSALHDAGVPGLAGEVAARDTSATGVESRAWP